MRHLCLLLLGLAAWMPLSAQQTGDLIHTVEAGETLISIASSYGVTLDAILRLNNLDPDAYLQIGQRLLVVPDAGLGDDTAESESQEPERLDPPADRFADAPVIEAAAPIMDPAELSPQICFLMYADANHNGSREADESRLSQGEITLYDAADIERLHYMTDGESEPYCLRDLERQQYRLEAIAPSGYSLRGAQSLRLDLRAGGTLELEFGAQTGQPAMNDPASSPAGDVEDLSEDAGLLREVSGLALMAVAALVLASGLTLALFLRGR